MEYHIRHAVADDIEAVAALHGIVDRFHAEALPQVFRPPAQSVRPREFLERLLVDETAALFIADADGALVGLVEVHLRSTQAIPVFVPRLYADIDNLVVDPACRRAGIGSALVVSAEQWAREHGASEIRLHVWEFNTGASALYEHLGYHTTGRRMAKPLRPTSGDVHDMDNKET